MNYSYSPSSAPGLTEGRCYFYTARRAFVPSSSVGLRVTKGGQVLASRLSGDAIAATVKQRVAAIGLDPSCYWGRSLRVGFATSAAAAGAR